MLAKVTLKDIDGDELRLTQADSEGDIEFRTFGASILYINEDSLIDGMRKIGYEVTKVPLPKPRIVFPREDGAVIDINDNIYQNLVRVKGKWLHVGAGIERTEQWIEEQAAGQGITVLFDGKRGN